MRNYEFVILYVMPKYIVMPEVFNLKKGFFDEGLNLALRIFRMAVVEKY
jgi:hypothetical protein